MGQTRKTPVGRNLVLQVGAGQMRALGALGAKGIQVGMDMVFDAAGLCVGGMFRVGVYIRIEWRREGQWK